MKSKGRILVVLASITVMVILMAPPLNCRSIKKRQSQDNLPADVIIIDDDQIEDLDRKMLAEQRRRGQQRPRERLPPIEQFPTRRVAPPVRRIRPPVLGQVPSTGNRPQIKTFRQRSRRPNFRRARENELSTTSTEATTSTTPKTTERTTEKKAETNKVETTLAPPAETNKVETTLAPPAQPMGNISAMVANSAPIPGDEEEESISTDSSDKTVTKSTLILGGAISGIAICIFALVMVGVMFLRKTETARSTGSIKKIRAKEQAQKRKIPRMKSVREMRETIFSSFRKVKKNRRAPRT